MSVRLNHEELQTSENRARDSVGGNIIEVRDCFHAVEVCGGTLWEEGGESGAIGRMLVEREQKGLS